MSMIDPKGGRPQALVKLAKAARTDGGQPEKQGRHADRETPASPADPTLKHDAAAKVLLQGVKPD